MPGIAKLGKYVIRRELGKGAMGVVYEGFDPAIERTVAIKTILPQQLNVADATDVLARFKREAQAAGRLNHPGIVAIYDYGEVVADSDDTVVAGASTASASAAPMAFIAMEFVKGRELQDYFEAHERFTLDAVVRLMTEILSALGHAHAHGVVHRDIKPGNLIVLDNGSVKIADFGIAHVEKSELTQAGTVMGTPSYMSPEQFLGQTVDGRSDLFSCGVILYQFLTGEKPFTGNMTTIMYKVLREEPLAPSLLNMALPSAFDEVLKRAMAKSPEQRFQTAEEFAVAIAAAANSPAGQSTATPSIKSSLPEAGSAVKPPAAQPATPTVKTGSGKKLLIASLAGLVLVVGGIAAYLFLGKDPGVVAKTAPPVPVPSATATTAPAAAAASADPAPEAGTFIISALGLVDPKDPRFDGKPGAAQDEARADAKRQLIEKALALYVEKNSLDNNYPLIQQKILSQSGTFIKTVLQEGPAVNGKDGLLESETRAVVKGRDLQKSLNQLSRDERIDFIRNNGDPKVAIQMTLGNVDTAQAFPAARSQLAENILKERIKSFGFRIWSMEGETPTGPDAKVADFLIQGEAKVKQLSARLPASGLTISKTVITSWTVKAIDKSSGEEIYLNTVTPQGKSWASEDQALGAIGKLMGDEFSRNFFLQHFSFGVRPTRLDVTGLPDAQTARLLLRELRAVRQVLDVQALNESGSFVLQLAQGSAADVVRDAILRPLNAKLGQNCFAFTGAQEAEISVSFANACADVAVRGKLETMPPAGLLDAPAARGKPLLKGSPIKAIV